jgi:hypothetical protein
MVYDGSYMATYMDRMIEVCYLELCSTGDVAEMYVCSTLNPLRHGHFLVLWIGKEELRIILCLADGDVTSDTLNIPNDVADIVERHSLVPFLAQVRELCWSCCLQCIDVVKLVAREFYMCMTTVWMVSTMGLH